VRSRAVSTKFCRHRPFVTEVLPERSGKIVSLLGPLRSFASQGVSASSLTGPSCSSTLCRLSTAAWSPSSSGSFCASAQFCPFRPPPPKGNIHLALLTAPSRCLSFPLHTKYRDAFMRRRCVPLFSVTGCTRLSPVIFLVWGGVSADRSILEPPAPHSSWRFFFLPPLVPDCFSTGFVT